MRSASRKRGVATQQAQACDRGAALEEARLAVERLVLPGGVAAELLPRAPGVLLCQVGRGLDRV